MLLSEQPGDQEDLAGEPFVEIRQCLRREGEAVAAGHTDWARRAARIRSTRIIALNRIVAMKTRTSLGLAGLLVIAASLTACDMNVSFTNSAPKGITEATLAKGYDVVKHAAIDPTTTFSASDKVVYCVVKLGNVPAGSNMRADWMTVKDEGEEQLLVAKEMENIGGDMNVVYFSLTAEKGLPAGNYRCHIYLNPKKDETRTPDKSLDFTAQ